MRRIVRMLQSAFVGFGTLALAATISVTVGHAEPLPVMPAADKATVGLWLFQEGQGDRVASAVGGPAGIFHGATWVPGIEGFAVATHSGHVSIPDAAALRPEKAITVEIWVKLMRPGGDLVCKNGVYMIRLGNSSMSILLAVNGKRWQTINGRRPVPVGSWTHLAFSYDSATRTVATYINGALDTKQELTGMTSGLLNQTTSELRLGTNDWRPDGSQVDGKIAALRISNIAHAFQPAAASRLAPASAPKGNLVPNGDFELGLMGWRLAGEGDATLLWGPDATDPASGRLCLRTLRGAAQSGDLRDPAPQDALLSRPIPVSPGMHYVLSARMRSDAAGQKASITAHPVGGGDGGRGGRAHFSKNADLGTQWKEFSISFVLPDDWTAPSLCIRIDHARGSQLWVDDVRLVAGDDVNALTLRDKICVGPKKTPLGHLYFADQPGTTPLNIVNTDAKAHRVSVKAVAVDWEGRELPAVSVGTFDVPASGHTEAFYSIDTGHRGSFRLGFELTTEGKTWRQGAEFKYAVIVPLKGVGNAEDSFFGMNTHMEREPSAHLAHNMEVLSQCGVKWIRGWWGWGMCEKDRGRYDWNEYDRQFNAVADAKMRLMPILLRYYSNYEQAWTGPTTTRRVSGQGQSPIQEYPYDSVLPDWSAWAGKIAERFRGRITAYEVWNEPTMGSAPHGVLTPKQYANLLTATAPAVRQNDPKAKIVGFAGVELPFMKETLALGVAPTMDVVSEHSYAQLKQPETHLTRRMEAARDLLAGNGGDKPIWHTEQGEGGDDDGYMAPSHSEAHVAGLFVRNIVVGRASGIGKYFWFSAQTSPTYGWGVFYEDYIPRPRLTALNACASFLEGTAYRRSFRPGQVAYAYLFEGDRPVCVVWNLNEPASLRLPPNSNAIQAFDTMGNPMRLTTANGSVTVSLPAERPIYLRVGPGEYALLEKALAAAKAASMDPVALTARSVEGGTEVTVCNRASGPQDGVVELVPPAGDVPAGWPLPQHFHSLAPGESHTLKFAVPGTLAAPPTVRARVGNREMLEVKG